MPTPTPDRGAVWLVDLGLAAKVRPCLILSQPPELEDRALVTVLAHTTSTRGSRYEVAVGVRFLKAGAFDAQNLVTLPLAKLVRKLGDLTPPQIEAVEGRVATWLGLD